MGDDVHSEFGVGLPALRSFSTHTDESGAAPHFCLHQFRRSRPPATGQAISPRSLAATGSRVARLGGRSARLVIAPRQKSVYARHAGSDIIAGGPRPRASVHALDRQCAPLAKGRGNVAQHWLLARTVMDLTVSSSTGTRTEKPSVGKRSATKKAPLPRACLHRLWRSCMTDFLGTQGLSGVQLYND